MVKLEHANVSTRHKAVLDKYGWHTIEKAINFAFSNYWDTIDKFFAGIPHRRYDDNIPIQRMLATAVLEYLFTNDEQLQAKFKEKK